MIQTPAVVVKLSRRGRLFATILAATAATIGYGIQHTPAAYGAPVFDTIRDMLPLGWWAIAWAAVAVSAAVAAVTRRLVVWQVATFLTVGTSGAWLAGLLWSHFALGHPVSWSGVALWGYFMSGSALVGTGQMQFEVRP